MSTEKIKVTVDSDLEELIPGFLENRKKDISTLNEALSNDNFESIRSIGHSLKGVGGGYGFKMISELGAQIETSAKGPDKVALGKLINELADYLDRVEVIFE